MTNNFIFYILVILVIMAGFLIVRKVATCLIKAIIGIAVIVIILFLYYSHMAQ